MTLLICPVRKGDDNPQLRIALRSWERNLRLHKDLILMTVGDCPPWLNPDHHISGNPSYKPQANVWHNIVIASSTAAGWNLPGDTLYMNDDFFCMDPVLAVPVYRRSLTLAEHAALYPRGNWFSDSLDLTASWLSEAQCPTSWSYDLHRPLLAAPRAMSEALAQWPGDLDRPLPQWRSVYGNLMGVEAVPVRDVKIGTQGAQEKGSPWISTSPSAWRRFGREIARGFQKPSRWER